MKRRLFDFPATRLGRPGAMALCFVASVVFSPAHGEPAAHVTLVGAPQVVFRWQQDACAPDHMPDAPARAFRDATGTVHLIASHTENRAMVGPDLDHVRPDCRVIYRGGHRDDPEAYDDRAWLASTYTLDGTTVFALVHNEFQGHRRPALCPAGRYMACWSNAITFARSDDGGFTFRTPPAPDHFVAAPPYRYDGTLGRHVGLFNPTNIVKRGAHFYALVFAVRWNAQQGGVCVMRTDRLDDPRAWRAWDGRDFTVKFADPYRATIEDPARHVCAPVARGRLGAPVGSITLHQPSGLYVAIMAATQPTEHGADPVSGIFASFSADLIQWSRPVLVLATPILSRDSCAPALLGFPSLLDPDSASRNFETTDGDAFIYATRFNLEGCDIGRNRDLIRLPVRITVEPNSRR